MASSSYLAPPARYGRLPADSTSSYAGDTPSTSSSSDPQFTPEASGTDEAGPSVRPQLGSPELPKLDTNLGKDVEPVLADETASFLSEDDRSGSDDDDDSDKYFRPPPRQRKTSPDYTLEEERGVVKRLDKRLVLFLAFLYMLSFLDRSSE